MTSTSGRRSPQGRQSSSSAGGTLIAQSAREALAFEIIGKLEMGDVKGLQKLEKELKKKGSSLVAAMAAAKSPDKEVVDSLLHMSAEWGLYEMCKYLTKDIKIDVNIKGEHGATPLVCAIDGIDPNSSTHKKKEAIRIVDLLLRLGADRNTKTDGLTPLHRAVLKGSYETVNLLLAGGAEVNATSGRGTNKSGLSALHFATMKDAYEIVRKILSCRGVDINLACEDGTALHIAAERCNLEMLTLLLSNGGNPKISDTVGRRPIDLAAEKGCKKCVEHLRTITL